VTKLWGGRFADETHHSVKRLNDSLPVDQRLWSEDIEGSIAHAAMLGDQEIIPAQDAQTIVEALRSIHASLQDGTLHLPSDAEDIHAAIEQLLTQAVGPVARKLHTARSRNDQVATDMRLYVRKAIDDITDALTTLQQTIIDIAEREIATVMPGYTHLQRAQPILLSHHLLAYFWMFERDKGRLADARKRVNVSPLGSGALAGTTFAVNRHPVANLLRFDAITQNSVDAVSDRDFVAECLSACALIGIHLSRLGEDIVLWNSEEFGFIELHDSVATGSSIMPQKKNPDVAELARGKAGRLIGNLVSILTTLKGLPLSYNKDLQEDKEPFFDSVDTLLCVLPAMTVLLNSAKFNRERMYSSLASDFSLATDLADELVRNGSSFRDAHEVVGQLVRTCSERKVMLPVAAEGLKGISKDFELTPDASISRRKGEGATSQQSVRDQLVAARSTISPNKPK